MNRHAILIAALAATLAACGGSEFDTNEAEELKATAAATGGKTTAPKGPTYALKTTSARSLTPLYGTSFAITSTYEVFFVTEITGTLSGHHSLSVQVFAPGASLWQTFNVSFATDVAAGVGEQKAEKTSTGYRVWVSMPIAGTMIDQYSLTGPWTSSAYIDGSSAASATAAFSLN